VCPSRLREAVDVDPSQLRLFRSTMSHTVIDVDELYDYSDIQFTGRKSPGPINLVSSDDDDPPLAPKVYLNLLASLCTYLRVQPLPKPSPAVKRESSIRPVCHLLL
jgi:hypothetical protein